MESPKPKKRRVILFVFLLFAVILSGCSGQTNSGNGTSDPNSDSSGNTDGQSPAPVTIQFWHIYSDGPSKDLYDRLLADFEEQHKHISVQSLGISFWDYGTKLSTAIAGGSGPDLALNTTQDAQSRGKSGVIVNLDEYIQRDNINMDNYFPILTERVQYNGSVYAMPHDTDVRVLFYNKEAFREAGLDPEKPPQTWEELESYAEKLTKWNDKNMLEQIGFSPTMGNSHLWTLAWGNGGDFWDDDLNPTWDTPQNLETLKWMISIQEKYGKRALTAFNTESGALGYSPFIAGKIAMIIETDTKVADIAHYNPDLDYGVAPIPYPKEPTSWSAGWDLEIIDNKSKEKADAAWELMKYLTSEEVQKLIHKELGAMVSNRLVATDPEFMADPVWALIVEQMEHSKFIEYVEASPAWHTVLHQAIEPALTGDVEPEAALKQAQQLIETEIKNFEARSGK